MRKYAPLFALSPRTLNCHPERPQGVEGSTPLRKSETERSLDALRLLGMTCESTCRTLHCRPVLCIVILSARSAVEGSVPFSVSKESGSFDCAFGALRMTCGSTYRTLHCRTVLYTVILSDRRESKDPFPRIRNGELGMRNEKLSCRDRRPRRSSPPTSHSSYCHPERPE